MGHDTLTQERVREVFEYRDGKLFRGGKIAGSPPQKWIPYWRVGLDSKVYLVHRVIFLYHHGFLPPLVDHIDRNKTNNRIENLREASKQENEINSIKSFGRTGYRGVSVTSVGRYRAYIVKDYKQIHIGVFATPEEASQAYERKREELFPGILTDRLSPHG